ncbi:putative oxidoreductase [Geothermobacter ehrlichii]|uniref:Putative oxidoreductase n=1 Tax=Geothermobacter ehrlichii TaxID=213224 RepID=A0A5D3WKP3_9BACT|nr:DoxX family protein [Geothermobacter ehrlichii]TYO98958.1 putative oxidoreductase [Geothermobacter ehrlichii]
MLKRILTTENDVAALVMRLALGLVMLPHGLQKTFGLFGGHGFVGTYRYFTATMGLPGVLAVLVILAESLGALGLIAGFLTRVGALGVAAVMTGAIVMVHWRNGFFMNWFGSQQGEGFEYHLLALGLAVALMIKGGGALSVDRGISNRD